MVMGADPRSSEHLLFFLFSSDSTEAIDGVREILSMCDEHAVVHFLYQCAKRLNPGPPDKVEVATDATRQAIESLLVSMLNDKRVLKGSSINGMQDPNLVEVVASQLAESWPDKYKFDPKAAPRVRAAQLAAIRAKGTR